ncbi:hypothetical protein AQUCO_01900075v1 [Aquilegia coerulea]|uniref:Uncharacterized protein n=1 Tax=Aquilegia coerulea TaxID=218851 RepID=A0A2G5DIU7_AQUCA|nr:hypothetical protein AQUCO_01900075v1 [Aquilegia coerulea]
MVIAVKPNKGYGVTAKQYNKYIIWYDTSRTLVCEANHYFTELSICQGWFIISRTLFFIRIISLLLVPSSP